MRPEPEGNREQGSFPSSSSFKDLCAASEQWRPQAQILSPDSPSGWVVGS